MIIYRESAVNLQTLYSVATVLSYVMPTQRQTPKAFSQKFQGIMDMRLHGSWRRTGHLGYLGIVLRMN